MKIDIITDNNLIIPEYIIDLKNKSKKTLELIEYYEKLKNIDKAVLKENVIQLKNKRLYKKKIYKKKRFYKKAK